MELANPHPTPQAASGNTEDKFMLMPPSPVAQDIPATPPAVDSGENAANVVLKTDIKRKRRTTDDLMNLKKAITEDYKRGIPLKFIAKKYDARIELVYKLFCNLQEERALPEQAVNYTIIETPKAFKEILKKFGHPDTDMIKIEKNPMAQVLSCPPSKSSHQRVGALMPSTLCQFYHRTVIYQEFKMGDLLSMRSRSDIRNTNRDYNETKEFFKNRNEYELNCYLADQQEIYSRRYEIMELDNVARDLKKRCDIPHDIKPQVYYIANSYGVDDLGALKMLLGALLAAARGRLSTTPKELWDEPGVLQTIIVGESGTLKSSVLQAVAHPFRQFEQGHAVPEEQRAFSKARQKAGKDFVRATVKSKLRGTIKAAVQSGPAAALEQLKQFANESAQFQIDANKELASTVQVNPCLILDTATPMGLANHLKEHGECASIMSAEADFIKKVILDSSAGTGLILRGATQEPYVRRSGNAKNEIRLERPSINILAMSQYSIAEKLYRNEELNDVGLTARLMPHFLGNCPLCAEPDATAMEEYNSQIRRLLEMYYTQDSQAEHFAVKLTAGAVDRLDEFSKEIGRLLEVKTKSDSIVPWLRKACGLSLRYALAYHVWRCTIPHTQCITENEMCVGIGIIRESLPHAEFAFSPTGLCALNTAQKIIDNIRNRPEDERHKLDQIWDSTLIQQRIGRKAVEVNNALQLLESYHWIILHDDGAKNLKFKLHNEFFGKHYR